MGANDDAASQGSKGSKGSRASRSRLIKDNCKICGKKLEAWEKERPFDDISGGGSSKRSGKSKSKRDRKISSDSADPMRNNSKSSIAKAAAADAKRQNSTDDFRKGRKNSKMGDSTRSGRSPDGGLMGPNSFLRPPANNKHI